MVTTFTATMAANWIVESQEIACGSSIGHVLVKLKLTAAPFHLEQLVNVFMYANRGIQRRTWSPLELQKNDSTKDIKQKMKLWMNLWKKCHFEALIEDMEAEVCLGDTPAQKRTEEQEFCAYNKKVLSGHLWSRSQCTWVKTGEFFLSCECTMAYLFFFFFLFFFFSIDRATSICT